jgi:hypothetical protein
MGVCSDSTGSVSVNVLSGTALVLLGGISPETMSVTSDQEIQKLLEAHSTFGRFTLRVKVWEQRTRSRAA